MTVCDPSDSDTISGEPVPIRPSALDVQTNESMTPPSGSLAEPVNVTGLLASCSEPSAGEVIVTTGGDGSGAVVSSSPQEIKDSVSTAKTGRTAGRHMVLPRGRGPSMMGGANHQYGLQPAITTGYEPGSLVTISTIR